MTDCARGCTRNGNHAPGCGCTATCPEHPGHCHGCQLHPAETGRLCRACATRVRDGLAAIPDLIVELGQRDGRIDSHMEAAQIRRPVPGYRTPSPAFDLADDTCRLVLDWVDLTADHMRAVGPTRYTITGIPDPYSPIGHMCRWLREHIDWAARTQPTEIHDEVTRAVRTLEHATSTDRHTQRIREPCPSCDRRTLTRDDGSEDIHCRNDACRRVWRHAEWLARIQAHEETA